VVTGASGAGKTTLVRRVASRGIAGATFHYFDSIGVPSAEQMVASHGSPANWQVAMTHQWIERLARGESGVCVLEGQVRPSTVREAFARFQVDGHVLLLDCAHAVREARLRDERQQPELNTRDMACWASYLRGQADALDLPVLDTSAMTLEIATEALHARISALASV
jgi:shikimate kinase